MNQLQGRMVAVCAAVWLSAWAAEAGDQTLTLGAIPAGAIAPDTNQPIGSIRIKDVVTGPDNLFLEVTLAPLTRYTVFQSGTNLLGSLPIVFLGEFTTDANGRGTFAVTTEIINQRGSFNINPAFAFFGVQGILPGAGAAANGGYSVQLGHFRIYRAAAASPPTVFGPIVSPAGAVANGPGAVVSTGTDGGGVVAGTLAPIVLDSN